MNTQLHNGVVSQIEQDTPVHHLEDGLLTIDIIATAMSLTCQPAMAERSRMPHLGIERMLSNQEQLTPGDG